MPRWKMFDWSCAWRFRRVEMRVKTSHTSGNNVCFETFTHKRIKNWHGAQTRRHSCTYSGHSCLNLSFMFMCPFQSYHIVFFFSSLRMSPSTCCPKIRAPKAVWCILHISLVSPLVFLPQLSTCVCVGVCVCVCVCFNGSVRHASRVITQHIIRYDWLLFLFGHDDPVWY